MLKHGSLELIRAVPGKKTWGGRNADEIKLCGWSGKGPFLPLHGSSCNN